MTFSICFVYSSLLGRSRLWQRHCACRRSINHSSRKLVSDWTMSRQRRRDSTSRPLSHQLKSKPGSNWLRYGFCFVLSLFSLFIHIRDVKRNPENQISDFETKSGSSSSTNEIRIYILSFSSKLHKNYQIHSQFV